MCVSVFAGCSLIEINEENYYGTIVATLTYSDGTVDNIDKRELLLAYSSYGYNYVQNYGYSYNQAIDATLQSIVDQRATIKAVEDYYKNNPKEGDILNDNETSYLWKQAYDSIKAGIETYYFKILNFSQGEASDNTASSGVVYKPYTAGTYFAEKTVLVNKRDENGEIVKDGNDYVKEEKTQLVIMKNSTPTSVRTDKTNLLKTAEGHVYDLREDEFKELLFKNLQNQFGTSNTSSTRAWKSAIKDYLKNLKETYSYLNMTDDEWLKFEIDRVYNILEKNYLVEKYATIFNRNNNVDDNISNVTVIDVLNHYSAKVRADYSTYTNGGEEKFASNILSNVGDVDYILNNGAKYFYVAAIKVNFSQNQLKEVDWANRNGNGIEKDGEIERILSQISTEVTLQEGNEAISENIKNVDNLYKAIKGELDKMTYKTEEDVAEEELDGRDMDKYLEEINALVAQNRANRIRQYMFSYSDDNTLKNADYNLVFGYQGKEVLASDSYNKDEIKEAIAELYKSKPNIGDMTAPVKGEDGYYIFFYAGEIENLFGVGDNFAVTREEAVRKLASTKLNIFSNKTLFDKLYEELVRDNFTDFQNLDIDNIRNKFIVKEEWFSNDLYN